jgi:hypothetical protein
MLPRTRNTLSVLATCQGLQQSTFALVAIAEDGSTARDTRAALKKLPLAWMRLAARQVFHGSPPRRAHRYHRMVGDEG